jgi:RNA polymerase sigma-70 factor (ECF subfamily)
MRIMGSEHSTPVLIRRAQGGDRASFDALVELYRERLEAFIKSRLGAHLQQVVEHDDVLQETLLRAYQSIERFSWRGEESFMHWIDGIAENVILNIAKKYPRSQTLRLIRSASAEGVSPSKAMRRDERFSRLEGCLKGLSEDHRTVILLARIEGLPIKEIARRMQRSESAVKNLLLRALKSLKQSFGSTESLNLPDRSLRAGGNGDDR